MDHRSRTAPGLVSAVRACDDREVRAEFDWIAAVSPTAQQQALRDLDRAFGNFVAGLRGGMTIPGFRAVCHAGRVSTRRPPQAEQRVRPLPIMERMRTILQPKSGRID